MNNLEYLNKTYVGKHVQYYNLDASGSEIITAEYNIVKVLQMPIPHFILQKKGVIKPFSKVFFNAFLIKTGRLHSIKKSFKVVNSYNRLIYDLALQNIDFNMFC
jgi:hypothetical protein